MLEIKNKRDRVENLTGRNAENMEPHAWKRELSESVERASVNDCVSPESVSLFSINNRCCDYSAAATVVVIVLNVFKDGQRRQTSFVVVVISLKSFAIRRDQWSCILEKFWKRPVNKFINIDVSNVISIRNRQDSND